MNRLPTNTMRRGVALILASAAAFGVMPVLAKLAYEQGVNTKTLLTLRFSMAALGMWIIWAIMYRRGERASVSYGVLAVIIAMGAVGYVGQSFSYFTAISKIPASYTGLLLYTYPALVTLLAWVFFRERLTPRKLAALIIGVAGTLLVLRLGEQLLGGATSNLSSLNPEGVAWGLASAVIYSAYIITGTRFTAKVNPVFSGAVVISSAAAVYLVWGGLAGELNANFSPTGLLLAVCIAVVSTVLAISTFFAGLNIVGPSKAAIISIVEPAVTVALASLVLGETLTIEQMAGGALILGAVVLLQAERGA